MNHHFEAVSTPISIIRFEIGKNYKFRFIGDSKAECIYKVLKRTKCFITIQNIEALKEDVKEAYKNDPILKVKVFTYEGIEHCNPLGNYAKSPILRADNQA